MMKGKGGPSGGAGGDQAQAEDAAPEEESNYSHAITAFIDFL